MEQALNNEPPRFLQRTKIEISATAMANIAERSRLVDSTRKETWSALEWQTFLEHEILKEALRGNRTMSICLIFDGPIPAAKTQLHNHFEGLGFKLDWFEKKLWVEW